MSVSTETAGARPAVGTLGLPWIIAASSVGTLIEWYDFYLYGVLALFFSRHFFCPPPAPSCCRGWPRPYRPRYRKVNG